MKDAIQPLAKCLNTTRINSITVAADAGMHEKILGSGT